MTTFGPMWTKRGHPRQHGVAISLRLGWQLLTRVRATRSAPPISSRVLRPSTALPLARGPATRLIGAPTAHVTINPRGAHQ